MVETSITHKEKILGLEKDMKNIEQLHEEKTITQEEYESKKKELEEKMKELKDVKESTEEDQEQTKKSDKLLIYSAIFLIALLAIFFITFKLVKNPTADTMDDLIQKNLAGALEPEQGYLYKGVFSFVKFDNLWYTQLQSIGGTKLFNIPFRFGPLEVENITIEGTYNESLFNQSRNVFVTFNTEDENLQYIALAIGDLDQSLIPIFNKIPLAACTSNESEACKDRFIVTCDSTEKATFFFQQANETKVILEDNCITLQGKDLEIVRATDRLLLWFFGVVDR